MEKKVQELLSKLEDVENQLGIPEVMEDQKKYRTLMSEHKYLSKLRDRWQELQACRKTLKDDRDFIKTETDPDFKASIQEEIDTLEKKKGVLESEIETLLVPPDPTDNANTIVEIRAGTGGDEAAIFVGDCVRMYRLYADHKGWKFEPLSETESAAGGYKEYQFVLTGENVYRFMKYEGGTHRVQRVPKTETQGRVHTSAITVAALIEPGEDEEVKIDEKELRIDTYRSSGAGGQHVNTTDSAVRITYIPLNIVVHCQQERSQIKNREKAMRLLKAKIAEEQRRKKAEELASSRSSQVGTGDRSERIRTYNFPQNRLTDHRIDLTLYSLDEVMNGDLDQVIGPLVSFYYQKHFQTNEE